MLEHSAPMSLSRLPRCRPASDVHALRSTFPWAQHGKSREGRRASCAVVGSSDILRIDPRGVEIDQHDMVFRLNNAPTAGWESAVGSKTSLRVVNHVPLEKWIKLNSNRSALMHTADGEEYESLLCAPNAAPLGCLVSRMHAGSTIRKTVLTYQSRFPSHRVALTSEPLHHWSLACNNELRGSSPSGGLLAVLLALATCDGPVSLYGFWPFCCSRVMRTSTELNYKYFQGNRTRFVCCSRGRERMEVEYAFYEVLARRGLLALVTPPKEFLWARESVRGIHAVGHTPKTQYRAHTGPVT